MYSSPSWQGTHFDSPPADLQSPSFRVPAPEKNTASVGTRGTQATGNSMGDTWGWQRNGSQDSQTNDKEIQWERRLV